MNEVFEVLLADIERHCNNFFNPRNDPDDPTRNHPDNFIALAERIAAYIERVEKTRGNTTNESFGAYSVSRDLEAAAWQKAFSRELSIYKRAKFI